MAPYPRPSYPFNRRLFVTTFLMLALCAWALTAPAVKVNATGGGCASPSFDTATNFAAGNFPLSLATADFNGDGTPDLVSANNNSANVSVFLNAGAGAFGAATNYGVGDKPTGVVAGDFNRDGKQDLATSNYQTDNISVLLGNGTGGFGAKTDFAAGDGPQTLVAGDFNRDGKLDLATADFNTASISVLLGAGDGTFAAPSSFGLSTIPYFVTAADLNRDGKLDLVVTSEGASKVSVLLGDGAGGFGSPSEFSTGNGPFTVAVADFNGDGTLDVATANFGADTVSVLLGNGTGGFGPKTDYTAGSNAISIAAGDLNGDGKLDLAVGNFSTANVSVLLGDGAGGFGPKTDFVTGAQPYSIVAADLDGDGRADLATANSGSNSVSVLPGDCVTPLANLSITKVASADPAEVGRIFTYNISVSNAGPFAATGVTVSDDLPTSLTFISATPSQGSCTYAPRTLTCQLGSLATNGSATIALQVKPRQTGQLSNTTDVSANEQDPNTNNNSATSNINVVKTADLKVAKTDSPDPIFVGEQTTYTMLVTNLGPLNAATGVVLTDSLPAGMTFVSATTTQGSLVTPPVGSTGIVTANIGTLAVNAQTTVTVTVKATQSGAIVNTASVSGNETDTATANNSDSATTTVKASALQKVLLAKQVLTGGCENTTGQVYLTGPAPPGGLTVQLSSSVSGASVPASVFIPAGQFVSPAFNVTTSAVAAKQVGLITATLGASSVSRGITINVGSGTCPP